MKIPYKKSTEKGRIIYNRRKHEFRVRDVLNIILNMSNKPLEWWVGQELQCLAVYQVAKNSFYPTYLNHVFRLHWLKLTPNQRDHEAAVQNEIKIHDLKAIIRTKTRTHVHDAINFVNTYILGVVEVIISEFVFGFFDDVFDLVWDYWDPYFSSPTLGVWKGKRR